ncbi:MAG: hypothetical protein IAE83_09900 [Anaerolinea sp.]|nr:hypothetical protein [Anaerolinea sp.]
MKARPFVLICLSLLFFSSALLGGAVALGRAVPDDYSCLRLYQGENTLIDTINGFIVRDRRRVEIIAPVQTLLSPDGRYQAEWGIDGSSLSVWVRSNYASDAGELPAAKRVVQGENFVSNVIWSPDSARFSYLSTDFSTNSGYTLTLVEAATGETLSQSISTSASPSPQMVGWSPDGLSIVVSSVGSGRVPQVVLSVWDAQTLTMLRSVVVTASTIHPQWAPASDHLAITYESGFGNHGGLIIPVRTDAQKPIDLKLPPGGFAVPEWSPDGRYLMVQYVDEALSHHFWIYQVEGNQISLKHRVQRGSRILSFSPVVWSPNSESLIYLSQPSEGAFTRNLNAFDLNTGTVQTLLEGVDIPLGGADPLMRIRSNPEGRIAVAFNASRGALGVDLMNADATQRVPLVREARSIEFIEWSADNQYVLVQWQAAQGGQLVHYLTWARADGSRLTILEDLDARITELRFIPEQESLVVVSEQGGAYAIDQVHMGTNQRVRLAQGLQKVDSIWLDSVKKQYGFWWQTETQIGYEGYAFSGDQVYRFAAPRIPNFDLGKVSISPSQDYALIQFSGIGLSSIWLAHTGEDAPRLLFETPAGPNSVFVTWAQDGKRFAVERFNGRSEPEIHLYSTTGDLIRIIGRSVNYVGARIDWTRCD